MDASPVLADSSYYIGLLREGRDPLKELARTAASRDLVICGVVSCEVGRGIRDERVLERFQKAWSVMIQAPADNRLWAAAADMAWRLDRAGDPLPLTDIVIACCALRVGATVLTLDAHFQRMPGVRAANRIED